jgi:N-acetylmuramoyl-L-alanine amidase
MAELLLDNEYQWLGLSKYLWILDAGHGGIDPKGNYTTAPAKMHRFPEFTIYEGVINRAIQGILKAELKTLGIDHAIVAHEYEDTPLNNRVALADQIYRKDKRAVYLSIHSNAGGGSGFEVFTSPGQTRSDQFAKVFCASYKKHFPDKNLRSDHSDGDADKEADFYVLRKTDCPAVLVENLFFDNKEEAQYLMSRLGQVSIAKCLLDAIKTFELT